MALVSGCAASTSNGLPLTEYPSFHVGFNDGCTTSIEEDKSFSTVSERDAYSFENDDAYRAGWRQGYLECQNRAPGRNDGGRILGERNEY